MALPLGARPWLTALVSVLAANVLFLALAVAAWSVPADRMRERIRSAFETGMLLYDDWRYRDRWRGDNQYNDCLILTYALDREGPPLARALGPLVRSRDATWSGTCRTLDEIVHGDPAVADYIAWRYTRYWHGFVPLTTAMLQVFELGTVRRLLKGGVYAALVLLLFSGARHRRMLPVSASIAVTGLLFWGVPFFGQGLSHAFGDAFTLLGLAALLWWHERLSRPAAFLSFCAAFGAGVAWLEFLTAQLPIGAALLLPLAYLAGRTGAAAEPRRAWRHAMAGVLAFGLGAMLTVALKQALVVLFLAGEGLPSLVANLGLYTSLDGGPEPLSDRFAAPLARMLGQGRMLMPGSPAVATPLYIAAGLAWIAAAALALARNGDHRRSDLAAFAAGPLIIMAWVALLPTHTAMHGWMSRMLIVPIGLGFGALFWQLAAAGTLGREDSNLQPAG